MAKLILSFLGKRSNKNKNANTKSISDSTSQSSRISTTYINNLLEQLKAEGNKDTTKMSYYKTWRKFNQFVIRLDYIPKLWEDKTCLYCTYLICEKQLQSSTVRSYVSAIKSVLKADGYEWDDGKMLLNTLTKSCKIKNDRVKTRLPIQRGLLEMILFEIRRKFSAQPYVEALYISAFLLAYYGLLRVGEITYSPHALKAADVHKARLGTDKKRLCLVLHSSKTHDRSMLPQKIKIYGCNSLEIIDQELVNSYTIQDKKKQHFCPVDWVQKFISMRQKIKDDNEQLFIFNDGTNLQSTHLRQMLRSTISSFQLDPTLYDTHSFRIGRATDFFKRGVDLEKIKQLGRWRSNAVYKYLREY